MTFWQYLAEGCAVSWPPAAAGLWLTWYLAKRRVAAAVERAAAEQNEYIKKLTHDQTKVLIGTGLDAREDAQHPDPPAPHHHV